MRHWINRSVLVRSAALAVLCSSMVFGAGKPVSADDAIKREFPNATTKVVDTRIINGVKVDDVAVTTSKGIAKAQVTEFGDFLLIGQARGTAPISAPAMETLTGLFKAGDQDVDVYRISSYVLDVSSGKKNFRLTFDAVGRLLDVVNDADIQGDEQNKLEKVDDKNTADKAEQYAKKYNSDATVAAVYKSPVGDDFYEVAMKQKNGLDARLTLDSSGRVFSFRNQIADSDIPKPVTDAFSEMFAGTKIDHAYRYVHEYYQLEKTTADGYHVIIKIRPNGDVMQVQHEGGTEAATAAAGKKKKG